MKIDPLKNNGYHGVKKRHGGRPDVKEWNDSHDTGKSRERRKRLCHRQGAQNIQEHTAHKYIERKEDAPVKIDRFSKLDAYKPQLDELMNQGIFNCVVLLERLQSAGYSGGISILKEYVHPYRPRKPCLPCGVTRPRQASRRKWIGASAITRTAAERLHKVPAFVMILGNPA